VNDNQTIVAYDGTIPGVTGTVTLFNSVTAFPPGGSLHLLGQQWFQYSLRVASDGGTATGTVTGSYSLDKGVTWQPFYTKSVADADDDNPAAVGDVTTDEVYIGPFRDVRFQYTNAVEQLTIFDAKLSLAAVKDTSKVVDGSALAPFDPGAISLGAVSSWYRNSTLTGAVSLFPDLLNPASPATQLTAARQPTGNADGSMAFGGDDCFVVPFHGGNQSTTAIGFGFWVNHTSLAATRVPWSQTGAAGASSSRGRCDMGTTGTLARTGGAAGGSGSNAAGTIVAPGAHFISIEYDGTAALGSRHALYVDNVFVATSPLDDLPAGITSATGTWTIGAIDTAGTSGILGTMGRNFYVYNSKMVGATQGLLTAAARTSLMTFEPLT
jgi:hypothetical protein